MAMALSPGQHGSDERRQTIHRAADIDLMRLRDDRRIEADAFGRIEDAGIEKSERDRADLLLDPKIVPPIALPLVTSPGKAKICSGASAARLSSASARRAVTATR